jgi:hypothetical protein
MACGWFGQTVGRIGTIEQVNARYLIEHTRYAHYDLPTHLMRSGKTDIMTIVEGESYSVYLQGHYTRKIVVSAT